MDKQVIDAVFAHLGFVVKGCEGVPAFASVYEVVTDEGVFFVKAYHKESESRVVHKLDKLFGVFQEQGVLVPEIIFIDDKKVFYDKPFCVMKAVPGKPFCEVVSLLGSEELSLLYESFGELVARIHCVTFDRYGETFDGVSVEAVDEIGLGPFASWPEMHEALVKDRLKGFSESSLAGLEEDIVSWFKERYDSLGVVTPRLLHEDLNQKNVFVKDGRVVGVIDCDGAIVGCREEELMRLEGAHFSKKGMREAFLKGYEKILPLSEGYDDRRRFYYFSRLLVHIQCVLEYKEAYVPNVEKELGVMREEITKLLRGEETLFGKNKVNT